MAAGEQGSIMLCLRLGSREMPAGAQPGFSFLFMSGTQAQEIVPPTFGMGLSSVVKTFLETPS